jgi:hypothetical protein
MADKKVTELTAITSVSGDDLLLVVNDPLGTPGSRKVTLKNFFSDVSVEQVYSKQATFTANVTMTGTNVDITSDVDVTGALTVDGYNVLTELDNKIGSDIATSTFATWDSVTTTNTQIRTLVTDRMQVANTNALVNDRLQVANAQIYMRVANVVAGLTTSSLEITSNAQFKLAGGGDSDPVSSNTSTEGVQVGTIWYSNTHLYIAVDSDTIKRIELSTF